MPRRPWELDPSWRATHSCVTLLSRAWRTSLPVAAGSCLETWREHWSLLFTQHLQLSLPTPAIIRSDTLLQRQWPLRRFTARKRTQHTASPRRGYWNTPLWAILRSSVEATHPLQLHIRSSQTLSTRQGVADVWLKIDPTAATRHSRGLYFMMARFWQADEVLGKSTSYMSQPKGQNLILVSMTKQTLKLSRWRFMQDFVNSWKFYT